MNANQRVPLTGGTRPTGAIWTTAAPSPPIDGAYVAGFFATTEPTLRVIDPTTGRATVAPLSLAYAEQSKQEFTRAASALQAKWGPDGSA
jgi:hypothetical protein